MWEQNKYFEVLALLIIQPTKFLHTADHVIGFGTRLLCPCNVARELLILVCDAGIRPALDEFLKLITQNLSPENQRNAPTKRQTAP